MKKNVTLAILFVVLSTPCLQAKNKLPGGFVYIRDVIPNIQVELRYYTTNNFIGRRIAGYESPKCIITCQAAEALQKVETDLNKFGLGLKLFDAYRPKRAVTHFVRWAKDIKDTKMKSTFYPDVAKKDLFKLDYIADRSSHSRGSTVDLTIISTHGPDKGNALDMGSEFDFFGTISWPTDKTIATQQRANRMMLQIVMVKHGFVPYPKEWWHFTLKNEPFPNTYFDFPVK